MALKLGRDSQKRSPMTDEKPRVWPAQLNAYSMELKLQLSAATSAFDSLEAHIAKRKELATEFNRAQREDYVPPLEAEQRAFIQQHTLPIANLAGPIIGDIQGFLAAAGVVNSILWPSPRKFRGETDEFVELRLQRGSQIRDLLGVGDESILNSRTGGDDDVRGGFLHYDEMIDEFLRAHPGEDFVSLDIGSASKGTSIRRGLAARWLDEDTLDLWVNGRLANLRGIRDELMRVLGRIQIVTNLTIQMGPSRDGRPSAPGLAFGAPPKSRGHLG